MSPEFRAAEAGTVSDRQYERFISRVEKITGWKIDLMSDLAEECLWYIDKGVSAEVAARELMDRD